MTLLERMYPNRCFDCLAPIPLDDVLCAKCKALSGRPASADCSTPTAKEPEWPTSA